MATFALGVSHVPKPKKIVLHRVHYRLKDAKTDTVSEPLNKEAAALVSERIAALGYQTKVKEVRI